MKTKLLLLLLSSFLVSANDSEYNKVRDSLFWKKLYPSSYSTLYCGVEKELGQRVTVEHVYAAGWIAESLGCKNRKNCDVEKYLKASSDMHNLWPALTRYNSSRRDLVFGEIEGETPRFKDDTCDFERTTGKYAIVEPRDNIKGQIARSYLYMVHWYDLPTKDLLPLMIKWHTDYPVTTIELERNKIISVLQGRSNPFIGGL